MSEVQNKIIPLAERAALVSSRESEAELAAHLKERVTSIATDLANISDEIEAAGLQVNILIFRPGPGAPHIASVSLFKPF